MAIWKYDGVVRKGIHAFKYRFASDLADEFVSQTDNQILSGFKEPLLIPIPLHKKREKWRGFNQSSLIANKLAKKFGIICAENILIRTENTTPQAQLGKEERLQNIRGKFAVNDEVLRIILCEVEGSQPTFVLVDDVWTTGSTMQEAAKVLKKAGVQEVWGFTLAS